MKWEPQRFDDEPNLEPKPQPQTPRMPLPYFPPKKPDYLTIIARIISIIVNLLVIIFILMLINGVQVLQQSLVKKEEKDLSWAADKQYKPKGNIKKIQDFIGYKEVKDQLQKYIDVVNDRDKTNQINNLSRGILLHGPPGTGKTFLAKCLAGDVVQNAPFFITTGSDFVEKYVGVGASRIRSLFETAKKTAENKNQNYFFIFIDEIDSLGAQRSSEDGKNQEQNQTLNALLAEIDGFISSDQTPKPIIIGATNRIDILDTALTREGRLGRHILLDLPDLETTQALVDHSLKSLNINENDRQTFAKLMNGNRMSPAQIIALSIEAKRTGNKVYEEQSKRTTIYEALDFILMGAKSSSKRSDNEDKRIATHELGHAIIAKALGFEVHRVTIQARGKADGYTMFFPPKSTTSPTKMDLIKQIIVALSGRVAEEIMFNGEISIGSGDDLKKAYIIAKEMVITYGMSLNVNMNDINPLNKTVTDTQKAKIEDIIGESYKIAKEILEQDPNKQLLQESNDTLCHKLIKNKNLDKQDFEYINNTVNIKITNSQLVI